MIELRHKIQPSIIAVKYYENVEEIRALVGEFYELTLKSNKHLKITGDNFLLTVKPNQYVIVENGKFIRCLSVDKVLERYQAITVDGELELKSHLEKLVEIRRTFFESAKELLS